MRRKAGNLLMIAGALMVASALSLFLYNQWDANRAETRASQVMEEIREQEGSAEARGTIRIEEENAEIVDTKIVRPMSETMRVMTIDGREYIGYLSIPALGLELPVMSEWSYDGLKIAPGRYSGSLYTGDLVIAGHNYARHFSPIKWLETGTEVDFTDTDQQTWHYQVSSIEQLRPEQVGRMIKKSETDDWELTLFTCSTGGQTRYAVRCRQVLF